MNARTKIRLDSIEQAHRTLDALPEHRPEELTKTQAIQKWKVIAVMPCAIDFYKVQNPLSPFYEFEEYERLIEAAGKVDTPTLVAILLGGDAGLRRGEIVALRRIDVDLRRRQLKVEVNDWKGIVDTPKSGRGRVVPLTEALFEALTKNRRLRGDRVLTLGDGSPAPGHTLRDWVERAQRRAGLESLDDDALHASVAERARAGHRPTQPAGSSRHNGGT